MPRAARCGYRRRECGAAAQQNAGRGPGPKPTDPLNEASHAGVTLSGVYAYAPPCALRSTELARLRLQSFGGDCREVQQKQANRVLNVLASTKRTVNPASIATRRPDFPLAACDITKACKRARRLASLPPWPVGLRLTRMARLAVLYRGDWYHRRGFASDLCMAEWAKLSPERQAEYVKVQSLEDLGEQVRARS